MRSRRGPTDDPRTAWALATFSAGLLTFAVDAHAQVPPPAPAPLAPAAPSPPPAAPPADATPAAPTEDGTSPKRPEFDYDGRSERTSAGDVLLWVPRVIFFPVYLVTEFVVRRPLGLLTTAAERGRWVQEVSDVFTFGPENNIGIVPTALIDFGFSTSVGVYFFYDHLGVRDNQLRVHAATGGVKWWRLTVADRFPVDEHAYVKVRGEFWNRPDWLFWGIGPESSIEDEGLYEARTIDGSVTFHADFSEGNALEMYTGVRNARFFDPGCDSASIAAVGGAIQTVCLEPTVPLLVDAGRYPTPPSFDTGYTAYRLGLKLGLDSRRPRPAPGSGVRLELGGEHSFDLESPGPKRWIKYGGSLGGFLDLTGHNRVIGLSVSTLFADPLGDDPVPFTELAGLGGNDLMRGFRPGRLLGRSAAAATLEYRYPIWAFLDGSVQFAVGDVFGEHLQDFDFELLRMSGVIGVRSAGERDHSFNVLVGTGTETFADGAKLEDLRFMFGATQGF